MTPQDLERRKRAPPADAILRQHGNQPQAVAPTTDNGLPAPERAAGIAREERDVVAVGSGNWLTLRQAEALPTSPDIATAKGLLAVLSRPHAKPLRGGGAHRWALVGRIHARGDGRRTAREYAGAVGVITGRFAAAISDRVSSRALRVLSAAGRGGWRWAPECATLGRKHG